MSRRSEAVSPSGAGWPSFTPARGRQICEINLRSWHFGCPASPAGPAESQTPRMWQLSMSVGFKVEVQPVGHLGNPCVCSQADGCLGRPVDRGGRIYGPASTSHVRQKGERERGDPAKHAAGRELPDS